MVIDLLSKKKFDTFYWGVGDKEEPNLERKTINIIIIF